MDKAHSLLTPNAVRRTGRTPEIMNTDQGSQFTGGEWARAGSPGTTMCALIGCVMGLCLGNATSETRGRQHECAVGDRPGSDELGGAHSRRPGRQLCPAASGPDFECNRNKKCYEEKWTRPQWLAESGGFDALVRFTEEDMGGIDLFFSNAGVHQDISEEETDGNGTNLRGYSQPRRG